MATLTGQSDLVRRLLIAGATLDLRNKIGNTALHIACEEGNLDVVKSILEPISSAELTEARQTFYKPQVQTIDLIGLTHNMNHEGECWASGKSPFSTSFEQRGNGRERERKRERRNFQKHTQYCGLLTSIFH